MQADYCEDCAKAKGVNDPTGLSISDLGLKRESNYARVSRMVATLKALRDGVASGTAKESDLESALAADAPELAKAVLRPWIGELIEEAKAQAAPYFTVPHDAQVAAEGSLRVSLRVKGLHACLNSSLFSPAVHARLAITVFSDWLANHPAPVENPAEQEITPEPALAEESPEEQSTPIPIEPNTP